MTLACAKVIWLRSLLANFLVTLATTLVIFTDNICAKTLDHNLMFHAMTKHIEVDHHIIYDLS